MTGSVLVTGASGFVGSRLVARLKQSGYSVLTHDIAGGDIASCDFRGINRLEHVVHLAAETFVPASWEAPDRFCRTNVLGTVNVLELCRRHRAALTYVSSYVYGQPQTLPIAEEHPRSAFNPYALSKIMAEDACLFYATSFGLNVCIVRPFNLYGPGQDARFVIPTLVCQALSGDSITVADERPKRDFLHVSDFVGLLESTIARRAFGIYNAGTGVAVGIAELVHVIGLCTGEKRLISRGEARPNEVLEARADISKAACDLAWKPWVSLPSGIAEVVSVLKGAPTAG